jgi:hypothetical protein
VAGLLYIAITLLRFLAGDVADASSILLALPVALTAMAFGLWSGVVASLVAVAQLVLLAAVEDVSLSGTGWASRVLPMVLLGVLLGDASDRLHRGEEERRRLESASLLHREAIEINDTLVQGVAAAKWSLEAGRVDDGLRTLDETMAEAQDLVSDLIRRADMGPTARRT